MEIGLCLSIAGFISCLIQLFLTPILLARCDHVRVYNKCMALWPYCFLALPLLNMVARVGLPMMDREVRGEALHLIDMDRRVQGIVWCGIAALLALSRLACLAFACVHFCIVYTGAEMQLFQAQHDIGQGERTDP